MTDAKGRKEGGFDHNVVMTLRMQCGIWKAPKFYLIPHMMVLVTWKQSYVLFRPNKSNCQENKI